jgi:hypothetical protein
MAEKIINAIPNSVPGGFYTVFFREGFPDSVDEVPGVTIDRDDRNDMVLVEIEALEGFEEALGQHEIELNVLP